MKKILFSLAFAAAFLIGFNSCTKEYITNNNYLPGIGYYFDIPGGNSWRPVSGNDYESYQDVSVNALDEKAFVDGDVDVSIGAVVDGKVVSFSKIPGTIGDFHYNFDYSMGKITLYVLDLAAKRANDPNSVEVPGPLTLKIILTDADVGN